MVYSLTVSQHCLRLWSFTLHYVGYLKFSRLTAHTGWDIKTELWDGQLRLMHFLIFAFHSVFFGVIGDQYQPKVLI